MYRIFPESARAARKKKAEKRRKKDEQKKTKRGKTVAKCGEVWYNDGDEKRSAAMRLFGQGAPISGGARKERRMKKIVVIDGQGGRVGRELGELLQKACPEAVIVCVGTNSVATATMMKSGIRLGATGENAVAVNARDADVIVGPIGIVMADSMLGEITPRMALAVAKSPAAKVLIPSDRCHHFVAGVGKIPLSKLLEDAVEKTRRILEKGCDLL